MQPKAPCVIRVHSKIRKQRELWGELCVRLREAFLGGKTIFPRARLKCGFDSRRERFCQISSAQEDLFPPRSRKIELLVRVLPSGFSGRGDGDRKRSQSL